MSPDPAKPADEPLAGVSSTQPPGRKSSFWIPLTLLLLVFLAGFLPMWLKANRLAGELDRTQRQLRLAQIQITLATAALDARRGEYEAARQGTASFFSQVTVELDRETGSALPSDAKSRFQSLLAQRDDLITLLARGDAASAERLAHAWEDFRKLLGD